MTNRSFISGSAGTGKTTLLHTRIAEDPKAGILCATTGISAINLNTVTINSLFGYFDTAALADLFISGRLQRKIRAFAEAGYQAVMIDEVSMMDAEALEIFHEAFQQETGESGMGIVLTGDFAQLPPIKAKWCFEADCWNEFDANTTRLTKVWRQDNPRFLEGINLVRAGKGPEAAEVLRDIVEFVPSLDSAFDGTTILPKNDSVDRLNHLALKRLSGQKYEVASTRWGQKSGGWNNIPETLHLKHGAYVMILSNDPGQFRYANGDCGYIVGFNSAQKQFQIKLVRNDEVVEIGPITRLTERRTAPTFKDSFDPNAQPYLDEERKRWIYGAVTYYPLRLAYASTVHKTQGLTLDKVQIGIQNGFFGMSNMAYVALSRCRSPEGLRIVGTPELLAKRIKVAPEITRWL